jgi:hypothetical protein
VKRPSDSQNIVDSLCENFDHFDEEEPMCSEARRMFRNEIVPKAKQVVRDLISKDDLDAAHALVELFETIRYFVEVNGPANMSDDPNYFLVQRADLDEDDQKWRP